MPLWPTSVPCVVASCVELASGSLAVDQQWSGPPDRHLGDTDAPGQELAAGGGHLVAVVVVAIARDAHSCGGLVVVHEAVANRLARRNVPRSLNRTPCSRITWWPTLAVS